MKPINNWDDITAAEDRTRILPGGYIARITAVNDNADKSYLEIVYDIAEGAFTGYYGDQWGEDHPYAHRTIRSYKETALPMFKAFTSAVEASNPGYTWAWAEKSLEGKIFGIVLGEEEYLSNRGEVKRRLTVRSIKPVVDIRNQNYTIPDVKRLKGEDPNEDSTAGFTVADSDMPF